uniref:Uncharacterized protein n=1 Tax=Oryza nivara TaxID=4536 RepID=A0A0E0GRT3_ORYNI
MARARLRVAAGSFLEREGETRRTRLVGSISFVVDELKSVDEQSFLDGMYDRKFQRTLLITVLIVKGSKFEPSPFHARSVPVANPGCIAACSWRRQQQQLVQGMESHTGINGVALKISHYLLNYAAMSRGVNDSI